jgi:hypothetical protein
VEEKSRVRTWYRKGNFGYDEKWQTFEQKYEEESELIVMSALSLMCRCAGNFLH